MILKGEVLVERAFALAQKLHQGQFRADGVTPYFEHPKEVRSIFLENYYDNTYRILSGDDEYRGQAIALLHDVVEDADMTFEELGNMGYELILPELKLLTKFEGNSYLDYLLGLKHSRNELAICVKLADMEANLKDLHNIRHSGQRKGLEIKYTLARYILTH